MQPARNIMKKFFFLFKILLATLLLLWVFSKAHWSDYVTTNNQAGAKSYSLAANQDLTNSNISTYVVKEGVLWWAKNIELQKSDLEPVKNTGIFVRKGVLSCVQNMNITMLIAAFLFYLVGITSITLRYNGLLKAQGIDIPFMKLYRLSFLGLFYSSIIPGSIGGDLVKAYYVNKHTEKTAEVLMSTFIDRFAGLVGFTLMSFITLAIALALELASIQQLKIAILAVLVATGLSAAILLLILSGKFRKFLRLERIYNKTSVAHHFAAAGNSTKIYRERPSVLAKAFGFTAINQIFVISSCAFIGFSIGLNIPFWSYYLYTPLIFIISAIPVTPGGVGVTENLYVKFFSIAAIGTVAPDVSMILVLAMFARLIPILWGIPGLWVVATGHKVPKSDIMQAELDVKEMNEEFRTRTLEK